jgi:hypothetical protein
VNLKVKIGKTSEGTLGTYMTFSCVGVVDPLDESTVMSCIVSVQTTISGAISSEPPVEPRRGNGGVEVEFDIPTAGDSVLAGRTGEERVERDESGSLSPFEDRFPMPLACPVRLRGVVPIISRPLTAVSGRPE